MLITPSTELGARVRIVDVLTRETIPCDACDTEEGWFDMYLLRPGAAKEGVNRVFVDRQKREMAKVRLHAEFDVVDRKTDEVLYQVRWPLSGNEPRPYLK